MFKFTETRLRSPETLMSSEIIPSCKENFAHTSAHLSVRWGAQPNISTECVSLTLPLIVQISIPLKSSDRLYMSNMPTTRAIHSTK